MNEALEIRRKRLLFRSHHRGTKETDLLLGSFAERHLGAMTAAQLDRYEALLGLDDGDLYAWIAGRASPPPEYDSDVLRQVIAFRYRPGPT
jgi:antitoxin CptB